MTAVLVSGGGIAGLALASLLRRRGFAVTVVERASRPRTTGQAVDVRGVALEVLDRLDVADQARALRTRLRGMSWLDGDGVEQWRSEEFVLSSGPLDSPDVEILREDLTQVLTDGLARADESRPETTELVYGDWITAIAEDSRGVLVRFEHGPPRRFDLVVGADGLYSGVRRLVFGPPDPFLRHLGVYLGVFGGANRFDLDAWQVWVEHDAATYVLYPVRDNREVRVTVGYTSPPMDIDFRDGGRHRKLIGQRIARVGWRADAMHATLEESTDFQFSAIAQVHLDAWSSGRVALVGDAASSPSPLSGQGTSLALVQAYVLAQELGDAAESGVDHELAFARYERRVRTGSGRPTALSKGSRTPSTWTTSRCRR